MLQTVLRSLFKPPQIKTFCTSIAAETAAFAPVVIRAPQQFQNKYVTPRQAWIENFDTIERKNLGLMELHPFVFAATPRTDIVHENSTWQRKYRYYSFSHTKSRAEKRGGGRKPWPQKGMGRARAGSIRSPIFRGGGRAHGPRSPKSHFYMLPYYTRILGLTSMLSIKLVQDDLHIIKDLQMPTDDPNYITSMIEERKWGPSVLIIDESDIAPRNITVATDTIGHVNIMPVYGLNVYSMLKHDTLILTVDAVNRIQERILFNWNKTDSYEDTKKYKHSKKN